MTYLYCLVRSRRRPTLRGAARGLPASGPTRVLDAGRGLWLVVADVKEADYGEAAIAAGLTRLEWVSKRALAHETVVERFLAAPALLPMQLFTIFTSDERALAHVAGDRRRIDRLLDRIAGHVEWGVRLTWDEQAARDAVEQAHGGGRRGRSRVSGADYLARKRDLLDVNRQRLAEARTRATGLHRALVAVARDNVRRTGLERAAPGARLLLDAAYLVPAGRGTSFRAAVRRGSREFAAAGIKVAVSGPWPPYNFISPS